MTSLNQQQTLLRVKGFTKHQQEMFDFWFDKSVPYPSRKGVPEHLQHNNQLYEDEM